MTKRTSPPGRPSRAEITRFPFDVIKEGKEGVSWKAAPPSWLPLSVQSAARLDINDLYRVIEHIIWSVEHPPYYSLGLSLGEEPGEGALLGYPARWEVGEEIYHAIHEAFFDLDQVRALYVRDRGYGCVHVITVVDPWEEGARREVYEQEITVREAFPSRDFYFEALPKEADPGWSAAHFMFVK